MAVPHPQTLPQVRWPEVRRSGSFNENSTGRNSVDREIGGVERSAAANEQPVQLWSAETYIGHQFWNEDFANQRAVGKIAVNPVAGAGPDAPVTVQAKTVE